ncbi:hypothetical protein NLX67_19765 [Domibacillus sp. A3M-37]|uniref:hypothetical protein n=1 Tax=Domibacillus sp. A3M-37 TaxID=2962037 RepID=UPI0020B7A9D2|nr:hypothetical protein [Domibacillus sp. A3M-37]MCP3764582.1 hypothetical protein [Domibacillus sp. A3M-37]
MEYETFKASLHPGLEFQKAKVLSKILKIENDGIRYSIGKNGNSKKVTLEEFQAAFKEIQMNGCITRNWYNRTFPIQAKTASCNFTTIGGLLQHASYVSYSTGTYTKLS